MMTKITQVNPKHCGAAQQLLWQSTTETTCDIAIIAEPCRVPPDNGNWVADKAETTAIQVMGRFPIQEVVKRSYEGFVCSCYALPRWILELYTQMLDVLTDKLIGRTPELLEKVILDRLTIYTEGENGLSKRQFGFRKKALTVDAARAVIACTE